MVEEDTVSINTDNDFVSAEDYVETSTSLPPLACPASPNDEPTCCGLDSMAHNHFAPVEFLTELV